MIPIKVDMKTQTIEKYMNEARSFAEKRDWRQFHSPKNLAMAMSVEVSELCEIFQWQTCEESKSFSTKSKREAVEDELIDIFMYWLRICDELNVDIANAFERKKQKNEQKYPAELVRGKSYKYDEY